MAVVTTVLCPFCHKQNQAAARFCQHCGRDIILNNEHASDGREYVITRVIKEGGQGAVYEAIRRPDDGRRYAVKEMLDRVDDARERDEAVARFNAEAQLLQGLDHPRIPRIYSHFTDSGRHYLAMDFIEGEDLEDIERREGALPEAQVLAWADQICDVLGYLHRKGLVYRDMKPSNVMIERDGTVKLIDFGIAKLFKPTERGTQIGTPGYAPPEQYQGIATPASDIYALGATLHHLLTGRDPRDDKPFDFPPPRDLNPNVSRRTSDAIVGALKMKPEERWGSVAELRALLRPLSGALPPVQVRVSPPTATMPASPQRTATPAPSPVSPPAPRPSNGSAATRQPTPAPRPAPQPVPATPAVPAAAPAPRRRRGGFGRFLMTVLVLAGIAAGVVYIQFPALWQAGVDQVQQVIPTAVPTAAPLVALQRTYEVQATLADNADDATVRAALRDAFAKKAQEEFGPAVVINQNVPPSVVGGIDKQPADGGNAVYKAQVQGLLLAPQQ
jgi:serine/threonine-protein kinase